MRHDARGSELADLPAHRVGWPTCRFRFGPEPCAVREQHREVSECCSHREPTSSPDKRQDRTARYHATALRRHPPGERAPAGRSELRGERLPRRRSEPEPPERGELRPVPPEPEPERARGRPPEPIRVPGRRRAVAAALPAERSAWAPDAVPEPVPRRPAAPRRVAHQRRHRFHSRFSGAGSRFRLILLRRGLGRSADSADAFGVSCFRRSPSQRFPPARPLEPPQARCPRLPPCARCRKLRSGYSRTPVQWRTMSRLHDAAQECAAMLTVECGRAA